MIRRFGRPGLIGLAARTAVVAGTATAVSGGMLARQQRRTRTAYEAAEYEATQRETAAAAVQDPAVAAPAATAAAFVNGPAVTGNAAGDDLVAKLQQLGELRTQGVLTDSEFEIAKARLLN